MKKVIIILGSLVLMISFSGCSVGFHSKTMAIDKTANNNITNNKLDNDIANEKAAGSDEKSNAEDNKSSENKLISDTDASSNSTDSLKKELTDGDKESIEKDVNLSFNAFLW